jgi:hypothetical protein
MPLRLVCEQSMWTQPIQRAGREQRHADQHQHQQWQCSTQATQRVLGIQ